MALSDREKEDLTKAFVRCSRSLVDYRHILLHNEQKIEVAPASFHFQWSDMLLFDQENMAIQAFRESAKTQYCIRSLCLHALTFPTMQRDYIVIIKKNHTLARKLLKQIEAEYVTNVAISGNLEQIKEQSGDVFDVDVMNADGQIMNVRIEAYGKGGSVRGLSHPECVSLWTRYLSDIKDFLFHLLRGHDFA